MIKTSTTDILSSKAFHTLTQWQENLYLRLHMVLSEQQGTDLDAEIPSLQRALYPGRTDVRFSQVRSALDALMLRGLIAVFPDENGVPRIAILHPSPSSASVGGTIGGDEQQPQQSLLFVSQPSKEDGESTENVPSDTLPSKEDEGSKEVGNAERLWLTEKDVTEAMERRNTIEYEARLSGLPVNVRAFSVAERLADQYSFDWLISAIRRAFDAQRPSWSYVEKILVNAKERGTIEDVPQEQRRESRRTTSRAKASGRRKSDAELDAELKKWGVRMDD